MPENTHQKIVFTYSAVNDSRRLFDVHYSDGSYCASITWMGKTVSAGQQVWQPGIMTNNVDTKYLSFDGQNNFTGGNEQIVWPSNGSEYEITTGRFYYFNNSNPEKFDTTYSLLKNNNSIRMNNISIFNKDYTKGVMMDLRASLEGAVQDCSEPNKPVTGYIVVLASIDTIE